jgi:hypothetical protein
MTWVKLDDGFAEHVKMSRLSNDALALWVVGLAYCNRNLTDGFIPSQVGLGQLRYCNGNTVPAIRELEDTGCWIETDGGWQVHDFHDYQPTKESVLAERAAAKERKRKSRARARGESQRDANGTHTRVTPPAVPVPVPVPVLPSIDDKISKGNALDVGPFVKALKDADKNTPAVLSVLSRELPEAAFHTALESLVRRRAEQPPLVSETRYFVAALSSMKREGQYA